MERHPDGHKLKDRGGRSFLPVCGIVFGATLLVNAVLDIHLSFFRVLLGFAFALFASRGAKFAWVPALLLLAQPALQVAGGVLGFNGTPDVSMPMLLMVAGGVLVFRDRFPDGVARMLLVGLLILGVVSIGDDHDRDPDININIDGRNRPQVTSGVIELPILHDLAGKTLVLRSGSGDIEVDEVSAAEAAMPLQLPQGITARRAGDTVTVDLGSKGIDVKVPPGVKLDIRTNSGDVDLEVATADVEVRTGSGSVDITVEGDPGVDLASNSGDIDVDGYEDHPDVGRSFERDGSSTTDIVVRTDSGDIDVERNFDGAPSPTTATSKPPLR